MEDETSVPVSIHTEDGKRMKKYERLNLIVMLFLFLAPVKGTEQLIAQEIEIFAVNETHNKDEESCHLPFTVCN